MHCEFRVGDMTIMASDGLNDEELFHGFRLALAVDDKSSADRVFNGLADGGQVDMPLTETFWSPCFGMLTDRFGLRWMVMVSTNHK